MLNTAASRYDIDPQTLTPLPGGHFNQVYGFERGGSAYVLRLTPPDAEINLEATRASLAFMKFLAGGGVQVPEPVESPAGLLVETLADPANPEGRPYLASVFGRAAGALAEEMPVMVWEDALLEEIGRAVGHFHARSAAYHPAPGLDRPRWDELGCCFNPGEISAASDPASPHHWVLEKRAAVLEEIDRLPRSPGLYGIIHADLHFGNIYFERQPEAGAPPWSVTLLDFDDCAYGWFAMDTAMNLLDAAVLRGARDWDAFAAAFLPHYLRGYRREHPFAADWLERLPLFLKLLELGLYLTVADDYDPNDSQSWVGKFMAGRRERIQADLPVVALSGL